MAYGNTTIKMNQIQSIAFKTAWASMDVTEILWDYPRDFIIWSRLRSIFIHFDYSGKKEGNELIFNISMDRAKLAKMIGVEEVRLNQSVKLLEEKGLVWRIPFKGAKWVESLVVIDPMME